MVAVFQERDKEGMAQRKTLNLNRVRYIRHYPELHTGELTEFQKLEII